MSELAWSYSRLSGFESCPKKFYHLNIIKDVKEIESAPMRDGKRDHEALDKRVRLGTALPEHLAALEPVCKLFDGARDRGLEILTECQWALTRDLQPTGWFDRNVWVRVILDAAVLAGTSALVVDYKTGRRDPDWTQLKLFAAAVMAYRPQINKVVCQFVWTKDGTEDQATFTRSNLPEIWAEFLPRVERLQEANRTATWPMRPNNWCKRCPVLLANKCVGG